MRFLLILVVSVGLLSSIQAQNKVSLSGKIIDDKQNPVAHALVTVENSSIGTYSDEKGYYRLDIPIGKYTFSISEYDHETKKKSLDIKDSTEYNFILSKHSIELLTVEVHGKTKTRQLREGSYSVNAIDVKTYANSLNNLNDLIGRSSGIKIRDNGGVGADFDLSINGLSGNSIRYFIDGVPLSSMGNGVSIANLPINLVDRVEVYKGVVPADLGIDALGGAINIITKKAIKNYLDVSYGMGSFHTHKVDLNAQYIHKKTGIFIRPTFGLNYSKNDYKMKGVQVPTEDRSEFIVVDAKRFHDDYFSLLGQLNIGVANKPWADMLSVTASYSYVDKELQTGSAQNIVYGKAARESKAFSISGQYKKKNFLVEKLHTNLSVSQTWDNAVLTDTSFHQYNWTGKINPYSDSRSEILGRGKSIRHTIRPLSIVRINFDYLLNENHAFNINYLLNHVANKRRDDHDEEFVPSKDTFSKHIIGLSYKQSFWNDKWNNTFFVKDYISHLKIGQMDLSWITGSNNMPKSSSTNNWGYGLSTRFRFYDWLAIKSSAERSVRLPLPREYMGNGVEIYPNFRLKPENSENYNLGLFGNINVAPKHKLFYEIGLFYRGVKDYIRYRIGDDGTGQYRNVANVIARGLEGEVRYEYDNSLQVIANISYADIINKTKYQSDGKPDAAYNAKIPNKPWLYGNAEFNYKKKNILGSKDSQLKIAYYFHYVHWFYLNYKGEGSAVSNKVLPTQCVHNLSVTYSIKNERYNISLECNNIFDRLVYDNYMLQKPGRSFFCKLRVFIN